MQFQLHAFAQTQLHVKLFDLLGAHSIIRDHVLYLEVRTYLAHKVGDSSMDTLGRGCSSITFRMTPWTRESQSYENGQLPSVRSQTRF